ncbi:MAG: aminoacyl-tRNA hydrolase [Treponema sp.]|nr:aminoacyl-tRNA hydrolase [Treponema sp.]
MWIETNERIFVTYRTSSCCGGFFFSFRRSRGQHVNKVNTKVTLRLNLTHLEGLSEAEMRRLREVLASRLTGAGEMVIASEEERSQHMNRERAFSRAEALIIASARLPKHRRPTKPSAAAREKRIQSKHIRSKQKSARRCSPEE